uniref:tetratricopeptide repeat protein n=1 Tax=uncultured Pigmentiphaga sp. TaxID=340361 RepID=UPI0026286F3F
MSARRKTVVVGLLAALIHSGAWAQSDPVKVLVEQGRYWQSRGNGERAAEAWQKLLKLAPNHPEALYGMGNVELDAGRTEQARSYLAQLKRTHPDSPLIARLEQAINLGGSSRVLQRARELARSGQTSEALATYQTALGGKAPEGPLALEYYQTLGGTPQGWDEARRGLEKLASESPNDPHIALALAQHLTYREATRREGIQRLAELAKRPDVGKAAADSWRKALAWSGTRPADAPLYRAYLEAYPDDVDVRTKLDEIERQQRATRQAATVSADPLRQRAAAGFQALDAGDLLKAENDFQAVLAARPGDGDALGGLGIVRLRQEKFAQAKDLLERASRQGSASRWRSALNSATYWSLLEQARGARASGALDNARRSLEQAIKLDPNEPTAQNELGDVLAESGQLDAAEAT